MRGEKTVGKLSGLHLPIPGYPATPHQGEIWWGGGGSAEDVVAVRGVVFDGTRVGFTQHDDRGWDIPFAWREDEESIEDAFERAAYEALGCYVRSPERVGSIWIESSRPLGMPYGRSRAQLRVALFMAPFDRKEQITEPGQNRVEWAPLEQYLTVPALEPLRPWLALVEIELQRRFSALS